MSEVVLISVIILIIIDILGLIVSIEFYINYKERKFLIYCIGWISWTIAFILIILSDFFSDNRTYLYFHTLVTITSCLAEYFVLMGTLLYFHKISIKLFTCIILFFIIIPLIALFSGFYEILYGFVSVIRLTIVLSFTFIPLIEKSKFKLLFSSRSYNWFFSISITLFIFIVNFLILSIQGDAQRVYTSYYTINIAFYYITLIVIKLLIVNFLIHMEYDISNNIKFQIKDKFSHDLGNIMQTIMTANELTNGTLKLSNNKKELNNLIQIKCEQASKLIKEIRKL